MQQVVQQAERFDPFEGALDRDRALGVLRRALRPVTRRFAALTGRSERPDLAAGRPPEVSPNRPPDRGLGARPVPC